MYTLHIASRYIVVHAVDQKDNDNKAFFSNIGRTFTDIEENKSFRITSVVKKGQEKRLYYRYYDIYEHPSGPPKISPFYDDVEEDLFEYTHCAEITNPNSNYVRWIDARTVDCHAALGTGGSVALPSSSSSSGSVSSARDVLLFLEVVVVVLRVNELSSNMHALVFIDTSSSLFSCV